MRKYRNAAILFATLLIAATFGMNSRRAYAQDLPQWDVDKICHIQIGPNADSFKLRLNLKDCIDSEQSSYNFLRDAWPAISNRIQSRCISLQGNGPIQKYSALATCASSLSAGNANDDVSIPHFRP